MLNAIEYLSKIDGLSPGVSFFLQGVWLTKKKKIDGFKVALKWKRKYQGWTSEEG
jgi:hypothetical protein